MKRRFSNSGIRAIYKIQGIMNHLKFIEIIKEVMFPYAEEVTPHK